MAQRPEAGNPPAGGPLLPQEVEHEASELLGGLERRQMAGAFDDDVASAGQRARHEFGSVPEVRHVAITRRHERGNVEAGQDIWIVLERIGRLRRFTLGRTGCLQLERAPLHRGDALAHARGRIGQSPGAHDRLDGRVDVAALERALFGFPGGLELR